MNDKLKPCPFCGGEAAWVAEAHRKTIDGKDIEGDCTYCTNCNAEIFDAWKKAREAWNRRVGDD